ncbi:MULTISPECIES: YihY family inner membrane protein [unclassified Variovorax]|uniref:YihY family inner membrane protein n=1 Tax=unclassified Variovorax TaxID=663243 RepID=UPI0008BCB8F3|nr:MULTISPECIES: YihY family inner membrane protein [unclassified Variovorax]SEK10499.1 YihY family inner membrane protein [Variovorax sp. OK202]SFD68552.1 membrane protein [Variovorax sp. OK212]
MFSLIRLTIERARKERLPQVAGSLAFTTLLSIVPLLAASFALFTRFPVFHRLRDALQELLLSRLLPMDIARTVMKYLNQFAANASGLTWVGSLFLLGTAVAMLLTVENALNQMWKINRNRPFFRRVGLYLLMLAVGPPVLGLSLWATSYLLGISMGLIGALPHPLAFVLDLGPLALGIAVLTAMFYLVPNTSVRLVDAFVGGVIASVAFELGKRGFTAYLVKVPTYKALYGTFAALPMFMLWVYFSWLVTLVAAMVTANLAIGRRQPAGKRARA